jgi:hypothetical protein
VSFAAKPSAAHSRVYCACTEKGPPPPKKVEPSFSETAPSSFSVALTPAAFKDSMAFSHCSIVNGFSAANLNFLILEGA